MEHTRRRAAELAAQDPALRQELIARARRELAPHGDEAEDVVQEAYLRLLGRVRGGDSPHAARAWLHAVVATLSARHRMRRLPSGADMDALASSSGDPAERAEQGAEARWALESMAVLPARERAALLADVFGLEGGGAVASARYQALHRARRKMRARRELVWGAIIPLPLLRWLRVFGAGNGSTLAGEGMGLPAAAAAGGAAKGLVAAAVAGVALVGAPAAVVLPRQETSAPPHAESRLASSPSPVSSVKPSGAAHAALSASALADSPAHRPVASGSPEGRSGTGDNPDHPGTGDGADHPATTADSPSHDGSGSTDPGPGEVTSSDSGSSDAVEVPEPSSGGRLRDQHGHEDHRRDDHRARLSVARPPAGVAAAQQVARKDHADGFRS